MLTKDFAASGRVPARHHWLPLPSLRPSMGEGPGWAGRPHASPGVLTIVPASLHTYMRRGAVESKPCQRLCRGGTAWRPLRAFGFRGGYQILVRGLDMSPGPLAPWPALRRARPCPRTCRQQDFVLSARRPSGVRGLQANAATPNSAAIASCCRSGVPGATIRRRP